MSEDIGGFLPLPKNIPKNYLKLSYPVHGNDIIFEGFIRLHVEKWGYIGFNRTANQWQMAIRY